MKITEIVTSCQRDIDSIRALLVGVSERLSHIPAEQDQPTLPTSAPRVIATIQGGDILEHPDGSVTFTADADIDADGAGGNPWHDPYFQPETSLKHADGTSLNSNTERYIVVPPAIIRGVKGVVLGCQAFVAYKGVAVSAVVGDVGPTRKDGEISIACAKALGIRESPVNGGVDEREVEYTLYPNEGAQVDGAAYVLQPYRATS